MTIPIFGTCVFFGLLGGISPAASEDARPAAEPASAAVIQPQVKKAPEASESDVIVGDRPGFTETPDILPAGMLQAESGFAYATDHAAGTHTRTIVAGSPLMRVGVGRRAEIRLGGDGLRSERSESSGGLETARGYSDFGVGAKLRLLDERGGRPAVGVSAGLSLPVGHERFTSGGYDPSLRLSAAKEVRGGLTAAVNVGVALLTDDGTRFAQHVASFAISRRLSSTVTGLWEVYRVRQADPGAPEWQFGAGLARTIGRNVQVDVQFGRALAAGKPCWFAGYGFAVRNPLRQMFRSSAATVSRLARR